MRDLKKIREEVEEIRDKLDEPVDPKIKELVIGLRALGIKTIQSCQGHSDWGLPYPWIDIDSKDANKLLSITFWYNVRACQRKKTKKAIEWVTLPKANLRLIPERKDFSLEKLQESAIDFGKEIQKLKGIPKAYKYI